MKTKLLKRLLLGLVIIYLPLQSMAWGADGHRIAGQIADSYLSPKTSKAMLAILGANRIEIACNRDAYIKSEP